MFSQQQKASSEIPPSLILLSLSSDHLLEAGVTEAKKQGTCENEGNSSDFFKHSRNESPQIFQRTKERKALKGVYLISGFVKNKQIK